MKKKTSIKEYIENSYLPYFLIDFSENKGIVFSINKNRLPHNKFFSSEEIYTYILNHFEVIKRITYKQLLSKILEPIYFTIDELISIQTGQDPFTNEEIVDIMCSELDKENYKDINLKVVDFCLDYLEKQENEIRDLDFRRKKYVWY